MVANVAGNAGTKVLPKNFDHYGKSAAAKLVEAPFRPGL
jgi:hypothetical protein